jgi:hypothetical protein
MWWNVVVVVGIALSAWAGWSGILADLFIHFGPMDGLGGLMTQLMGVMLRGPFGAIWAVVAAWHVLCGLRLITN